MFQEVNRLSKLASSLDYGQLEALTHLIVGWIRNKDLDGEFINVTKEFTLFLPFYIVKLSKTDLIFFYKTGPASSLASLFHIHFWITIQ